MIFYHDVYMALLFDVDCYLIQSFISCHIDSHVTDRWEFRWLDQSWDTQQSPVRDYSHHHLHMLDTVQNMVKISFQYKRLVTIYTLESKYPTEWCFKAIMKRTVVLWKWKIRNILIEFRSTPNQLFIPEVKLIKITSFLVCWRCSMFWQIGEQSSLMNRPPMAATKLISC